MSEAQKLLIERAGRTCERSLQAANRLAQAGHFHTAATFAERASLASAFAFFVAVQS